jgi:hypothetical protein
VSARIYHVGIVVADLDAAMAELGETAGLRWGKVQRYALEYGTPAGPRVFDPSFVISLDGPPHVELLGQLAGSMWAELGLHHLGLWSDDVPAESAALAARGCAWESALMDAEGRPAGGCYHRLAAAGVRVELVSRANSAPALTRYLAGGDYR